MADVWQYLTGRCDDSCSCSSHFYWWSTDWMYEYCLSFAGCCDRSIVLWLYMSSCIKLKVLALGVSTTKYLQYNLNQLTGHRHTHTSGSCPVHWVTLKNKHTSTIIVAESLQSRSQTQQRSVRDLPTFLIQQYRLVVSHAALVALIHTANKTSRRLIQYMMFLLHNSVLSHARWRHYCEVKQPFLRRMANLWKVTQQQPLKLSPVTLFCCWNKQ